MIKNSILYLIMISLILLVGFVQSWNVALLILNMCIISSIMSLGVNIQYGYAGLFKTSIVRSFRIDKNITIKGVSQVYREFL